MPTAGAEPCTATIAPPVATDAAAVYALIEHCPPLDRNSLYCNLLQCTDFAGTSAIARSGNEVRGFVSGYRKPDAPDVLFIWQVAVAEAARGQALGRQMILDILDRTPCRDVTRLHTTVTRANKSSLAMFTRLAATLQAPMDVRPHFDRQRHLAGRADSEALVCIGPFDRRRGIPQQETAS